MSNFEIPGANEAKQLHVRRASFLCRQRYNVPFRISVVVLAIAAVLGHSSVQQFLEVGQKINGEKSGIFDQPLGPSPSFDKIKSAL